MTTDCQASRGRRAGWAGIVALSASLVFAPSGGRAEAVPPTSLAYTAYVGGVAFGAMAFDVAIEDDAYALTFRMRTEGFLGWLLPWSQTVRASGDVAGTVGLRPRWLRNDGLWRGRARHIQIDFGPDGATVSSAEPPLATEDRDPVPPDATLGVTDLMSAIVEVARGLDQDRGCARRIAVFDGRRRYDVLFADGGPEILPQSSYASIAGPAIRCNFHFELIAGGLRSGGSTRLVAPDAVSRVWFKEIGGGLPPVPVRFETETNFGLLVVHLTRVGLPAVD
ncbi:MAG: DUF3108 domain-containing protein [Alphaproteobacteria bacterium]|nr:DUF3108 domain-containing protein [Alphaproteobacteria bacterium]